MKALQSYHPSVFCLSPLRAGPHRNAFPHSQAEVYTGAVFEGSVPHDALCPCDEKHEAVMCFRHQGEKPFAIPKGELPSRRSPADWGGHMAHCLREPTPVAGQR